MMLEDDRFESSAPRLEVEGYCFEVRVLDCEPCVLVDAVALFCGFANSKSMLRMLRRNTEGFGAVDCPRISGVQLIPLSILSQGLRRSHSWSARMLAAAAEAYIEKVRIEPQTSRLKAQRAELKAQVEELKTQEAELVGRIREIETEIDRLEIEISRRETQILYLRDEISKRETKNRRCKPEAFRFAI